MTEGERIVALNSSNNNTIKAMQLNCLFIEASQAGPAHQVTKVAYASTLSRNALIAMDRVRPR